MTCLWPCVGSVGVVIARLTLLVTVLASGMIPWGLPVCLRCGACVLDDMAVDDRQAGADVLQLGGRVMGTSMVPPK